jgi:hypothetical protein
MKKLFSTALVMGALVAAVIVLRPTPVHTQSAGQIGNPVTVPGIDKPVRVIRGRFTSDVTLTADTYWVLRGAVFIGSDDGVSRAKLTIAAGTRVVGETATRGTLVIERGAQIIANGTAAAPIVMTSDQPVGRRFRGDWGGLVINGNAPLNLPGGQAIGEGATGRYGGTNPTDNSGVLRFVRVEFAGIEFSPDNELNGIAFQGVGSGTIVENIQVSWNKDDGIEMFGGTVNIKRVVLTNIGDDSIDWTWGWTGKLQFAVVQQRGDDTDQGIEADNHSTQQNLLPRSQPTIYNITLVGDPTSEIGPESTNGMRLRVGTAGIIKNWIVTGFKQQGIDIRDASTTPGIAGGIFSVTNGILWQNGRGPTAANASVNWATSATTVPMRTHAGTSVTEEDPMLVAAFNRTAPDWRPLPGSPALVRTPAVPPNDGFFEVANFLGALGPDVATDWTRGWTFYGR